MPTPKERNALIFLAALGAIGVGARAFRSAVSPSAPPPAAFRAALDRQIGAVDSATTAKRTASAKRSKGRRAPTFGDTAGRLDTAGRSVRRSTPERRTAGRESARRVPPTTDSAAPDPLALYEARRLRVEQLNKAVQARIDRERATPLMGPDTATERLLGRHKKPVNILPVPAGAIRP